MKTSQAEQSYLSFSYLNLRADYKNQAKSGKKRKKEKHHERKWSLKPYKLYKGINIKQKCMAGSLQIHPSSFVCVCVCNVCICVRDSICVLPRKHLNLQITGMLPQAPSGPVHKNHICLWVWETVFLRKKIYLFDHRK